VIIFAGVTDTTGSSVEAASVSFSAKDVSRIRLTLDLTRSASSSELPDDEAELDLDRLGRETSSSLEYEIDFLRRLSTTLGLGGLGAGIGRFFLVKERNFQLFSTIASLTPAEDGSSLNGLRGVTGSLTDIMILWPLTAVPSSRVFDLAAD
jgi:hypothetical protein